MLRRLREFFRSGAIALDTLTLAELVQDSVAAFAEQAAAAQVTPQVHPVPAATLLGDRIQLDIVLRNLLANAVQALAEGPGSTPPATARRITVDAGVEGLSVWVRIADNGPGIADTIRSRLFQPFVSLKSSGLGLGLAISRAIVEAHGGTLTAAPGRHAVFTMTLPAQGARGERKKRDEH